MKVAEFGAGLSVRVVAELGEVSDSAWDGCANPEGAPYDPFLSHAFLSALESSGSVSRATGWLPCHLALEQTDGSLLAVMPLYLKGHSQGEYVFDYAWAEAFERAGGRYYPKLLSAIPFTPATGRRFLLRDSARLDHEAALLSGLKALSARMDVSSVHINFLPEAAWRRAGDAGFLLRSHQQFHWQNDGYRTFDDFLAALSSKKRKNIRRERRESVAGGVEIEWLTGSEIREHHWDEFFRFYLDTGSRKWGTPYLNREFFSLIGNAMAEDLLLIMCRRAGRYIAGAINFIGSECLFGRNWGCIEQHPFLHFEVCYYQAIDFAIERGLERVEAGAQGEHKLARGYLPSHTYSAHWVAHAGFRQAVADFLESERLYVDRDINLLAEYSPFREEQGGKKEEGIWQ